MAVMAVVTDSKEGDLALNTAIDEAKTLQTTVVAVNLGLREIDSAKLQGADVTVVERTQHDSHADVVLHALEQHPEAHRLVIGVKRRSKVGKVVLGSTSQTLILQSPVPVLAVKLPD